jgi:hypothetical protein
MKRNEKTVNVIVSYEQLVKQVKNMNKKDDVVIKDIELPFEVNLHQMLVDAGFYDKTEEGDMSTLTCSLIFDNVKCKDVRVSSLGVKDASIKFQIRNSYIDSLCIQSCILYISFMESSVMNLTINDSIIQEDIELNFSKASSFSPVTVHFDNTSFRGNLTISNLTMTNKISEFLMSGEESEILGDFMMNNLIMLDGNIDLSCNFKQNCIFRKVNSGLDENKGQSLLNLGSIYINGGEIKGDLVLEYCHLNIFGIANSAVGRTREFVFSYNQLKYDAARILRDGALKRNDIVYSEKYIAEVFDARIKEKAVNTYRKWASSIESPIKKKHSFRHFVYHLLWEPIFLFIPSFTSEEGIILWLNKYSNDFNRSWLRAVFFTLNITLFSYVILNYFGMEEPFFVFDPRFNGFGEVAKGYLSLLDIFNLTGITDKISYNLTPCGYIILFIAKVLITYGLWQTIYAFYKYRK